MDMAGSRSCPEACPQKGLQHPLVYTWINWEIEVMIRHRVRKRISPRITRLPGRLLVMSSSPRWCLRLAADDYKLDGSARLTAILNVV